MRRGACAAFEKIQAAFHFYKSFLNPASAAVVNEGTFAVDCSQSLRR